MALIERHMLARTEAVCATSAFPEFIAPVPLVALAVLVLNDHWWKGSGIVPSFITGKLSDFAGLLYFPLFATAALRALCAAVGRCLPVEPKRWEAAIGLSVGKLVASCIVTGAGFTLLKLSPWFVEMYLAATGGLGFPSRVTQDPTDLWALTMLPLSCWIGVNRTRRSIPPR